MSMCVHAVYLCIVYILNIIYIWNINNIVSIWNFKDLIILREDLSIFVFHGKSLIRVKQLFAYCYVVLQINHYSMVKLFHTE